MKFPIPRLSPILSLVILSSTGCAARRGVPAVFDFQQPGFWTKREYPKPFYAGYHLELRVQNPVAAKKELESLLKLAGGKHLPDWPHHYFTLHVQLSSAKSYHKRNLPGQPETYHSAWTVPRKRAKRVAEHLFRLGQVASYETIEEDFPEAQEWRFKAESLAAELPVLKAQGESTSFISGFAEEELSLLQKNLERYRAIERTALITVALGTHP